MVRLLLLLVCLTATAAAEPDPASRLQARLAGMASFAAGFRQLTNDGLIEEEGSGYCWLQRPLHFRWRVDEPLAQTLVSDGKTLWSYDPDLNQVVMQRLIDQLEGSPAVVLTGELDHVREEFDVQFQYEEGREVFTLVPVSPNSKVNLLRISFSGGALHNLLLSDQLGQTSEFRFFDPLVNRPIEADVFRFITPPGTDVIRDL